MPTIRLQSSDGNIFDTDVEIAKCFGTIKTMLEDCGIEGVDDTIVPLANVTSTILRKVLDWATYQKNEPEPPVDDGSRGRIHTIPQWYADFLRVDQGTLFDLVMAASYLDAKQLLDYSAKTVANMMKGKSPEEIRKMFNIENDFPVEEKERIRKEDEWCEGV